MKVFIIVMMFFIGCYNKPNGYWKINSFNLPDTLESKTRKKERIDLFWMGHKTGKIDTTFNRYGDTLFYHK